MKRIAILGSTGSIGTQALNVIRRHRDLFAVEVLCAGSNADLLIKQAIEFEPNAVAIADETKYNMVQEALVPHDIKVFCGMESVADLMEMDSIDMVLASIVGFAGLRPTLRAIEHHKPIALANKETMVVAGEIVTRAAMENHVPILPVDSEHSAIFQSLVGEGGGIDKILLTASGGPFRGFSREQLSKVTLADALKHPNWSMGRKVTIDSASLMNKGLEVIEARWLFSVPADRIQVLVHPQSVVHSMVQYVDGSIKAQLGVPTMETPIQYAFSFPERIESHLPRLSFEQYGQLTFENPDMDTFRCLALAYQAIEKGGNMPCIMNAANEVAVQRFIDGKLSFLQIADFVEEQMVKATFVAQPTLDDLLATDEAVRRGV
ncbi:MAG: 1-deoxy-D-xylulose-5-phosphate reductoisomerase [Bacteroidales bacterium]|nr:1-deoxy-D-xylulose-5-phosphate reductoisomerase [Candidatus Colimorpha merdihippi]MCQ2281414.1 1-deoxy-D-xylulose-5-phosphate reductoisomerase [Bacteroidales bacterium]